MFFTASVHNTHPFRSPSPNLVTTAVTANKHKAVKLDDCDDFFLSEILALDVHVLCHSVVVLDVRLNKL